MDTLGSESPMSSDGEGRFIYVPAPHTAVVICEELYEALVEWNLDEKISTLTLDNYSSNDKVAGTRYPTLRKIARDIYAIPVTTVASESAFSTSGRVLSEHRSRLTPEILEALMCSQDWLRYKYKGVNEETTTFWTCLQEIQDGMESCSFGKAELHDGQGPTRGGLQTTTENL